MAERPLYPLYVVNVEAVILRGERYLTVVRGEGEAHAPGTLSLPGGKVERADDGDDVLERTLRREVLEEVGVDIGADLRYLESKSFVADDGEPVVDIIFLCRYGHGEPRAVTEEIAEVRWRTAGEVFAHPKTPPWLRRSLERAERVRLAR